MSCNIYIHFSHITVFFCLIKITVTDTLLLTPYTWSFVWVFAGKGSTTLASVLGAFHTLELDVTGSVYEPVTPLLVMLRAGDGAWRRRRVLGLAQRLVCLLVLLRMARVTVGYVHFDHVRGVWIVVVREDAHFVRLWKVIYNKINDNGIRKENCTHSIGD